MYIILALEYVQIYNKGQVNTRHLISHKGTETLRNMFPVNQYLIVKILKMNLILKYLYHTICHI